MYFNQHDQAMNDILAYSKAANTLKKIRQAPSRAKTNACKFSNTF